MTIQQIRYALKIAETGSVCRAARMLGVRQPSVSSAVAQLEREMHIVIFERNSKGMRMTDRMPQAQNQKAQSCVFGRSADTPD